MSESLHMSDYPNEYDPLAPETFDSSFPLFRELRAKCPIAHSEAYDGFWAVTRYQDIVDILEDPNFTTFVRNVIPGNASTARRPPLHYDPPAHTPYRKALERAVSGRRVAELESIIIKYTSMLLDPFVAKGGGDYTAEVGNPLPCYVFGAWFGMTEEQIVRLADMARIYADSFKARNREVLMGISRDLGALGREILEDRVANPRDPNVDPVSSLLASNDEHGEPLTVDKLIGCLQQLLVIGLLAPPILTGAMVVHLARDPDLLKQLRADPSLIPHAAEEFIRLYTPYRGFARTSYTEIEMHGRTIRPGEPMALIYASANRDETVFEDPDKFILKRPNISKHIAFGRGPHRCAGMPIARFELLTFLRLFVEKVAEVELSGEIEMGMMPELGPTSVPVRVVAG